MTPSSPMTPTVDLQSSGVRAVQMIRSAHTGFQSSTTDQSVRPVTEIKQHCPVLTMIRRSEHVSTNCTGSFPSAQLVRSLLRWHHHVHLDLNQGSGFASEMTVIEHQLDAIHLTNHPDQPSDPSDQPSDPSDQTVRSDQAAWLLIRALLTGPVYLQAMEPGLRIPDLEQFARTALSAGLPLAVLTAIQTSRDVPPTSDAIGGLSDQLSEFTKPPRLELVRPTPTNEPSK